MQLTQEQIEFLDKVVWGGRNNWTLNSDGKVDVNNWVIMSNMGLTEIPVKFGRISIQFNCAYNNLTTLKNCPDYVGKRFNCSNNNLTTLDDLPEFIGEIITIYNNPLKDYFKNIKESNFIYWGEFQWVEVLKEYPFLINITKNYVSKKNFIRLIEEYPKTKLYLR